MDAAHGLSPRSNLLPERPFWKEAAPDYVIGSGLCKDVAGPGGTGGTEQCPQALLAAPSRNFASWAGFLLPHRSAAHPGTENCGQGGVGEGRARLWDGVRWHWSASQESSPLSQLLHGLDKSLPFSGPPFPFLENQGGVTWVISRGPPSARAAVSLTLEREPQISPAVASLREPGAFSLWALLCLTA